MTDPTITPKRQQSRYVRGAMKGVRAERKRPTPRPEPPGRCFDVRQFRPGAEHLNALGDRPLAEFLWEVGDAHGISGDILKRLDRWRERLTPELLHQLGGDRWPPTLAVLRGGRR